LEAPSDVQMIRSKNPMTNSWNNSCLWNPWQKGNLEGYLLQQGKNDFIRFLGCCRMDETGVVSLADKISRVSSDSTFPAA
jgi:hypothetical protein